MKTIIKDFEFKTIIGCLEFEREHKQIITLDIEYQSSDIIDYRLVMQEIELIYKNGKFEFVEESIKVTFEKLKLKFPNLISVKIRVIKPQALKNCKVGAMDEIVY
ncbi:MAG: dihydroneopterin aldolase [Campylobacter sputorum]|uniref:dihydroneopterin aldolase n=1 Tax=Campylobacter sputorum TaxID=206 RepID=UPI000B7955D0|nr:dihydroneopterin aldolase [Campylobacter sputorum]ASM37872.1 dihydroneopterin aldolase [Campylobacter sputorum bv. paraureolyticus LMG 11764]MDY6121023.1 dihydroneopterin aldolase [Campylobacter sputorum]